jgi:uncharacterized protein (UPF0147 family)
VVYYLPVTCRFHNYFDVSMISVSFNSYNNVDFSSRNKEILPNTTTDKEKINGDNKYQDKVSISVQARERALVNTQKTQSEHEGNINALKYGDLNTYDNMTYIEKAHQAILDKRMGLDREKIEEINDKMEAIINDKSIPEDVKKNLLENLAKEKEAEYKKAAERTEEQTKSKDTRKTIEA